MADAAPRAEADNHDGPALTPSAYWSWREGESGTLLVVSSLPLCYSVWLPFTSGAQRAGTGELALSSFRRCAGWWATPVVRTVAFGSLGLAPVHSYAAVFKCINQAGRVAYQSAACELSAAQSSVKIDPPPPSGPGSAPGGGAVVARTGAADAAAQQQEAANAAIHATAIRATWQRLGRAFDNGDIEAALRELTPAAQDKYRPVFALVRKNLPSFRFAQLGTMHSIKVIDGVAEIKIVRDKPGGPFGYVTSLVQTTDGRWLISGM